MWKPKEEAERIIEKIGSQLAPTASFLQSRTKGPNLVSRGNPQLTGCVVLEWRRGVCQPKRGGIRRRKVQAHLSKGVEREQTTQEKGRLIAKKIRRESVRGEVKGL